MMLRNQFGRKPGQSEAGQTMILFGLLTTVLMGFLAVTVDIGYAYSQRRLVQNTADLAAMAGTNMLYRSLKNPREVDPTKSPFDVDADSRVYTAVQRIRSETLTGTTEGSGFPLLQAYYISADERELGPVGGGTTPIDARGIGVDASRTFPTWFAMILPTGNSTGGGTNDSSVWRSVEVAGSARALLVQVSNVVAGKNGNGPQYDSEGNNTNGTTDFFPYIVWMPSDTTQYNCKFNAGAEIVFMQTKYQSNYVDMDCNTGLPDPDPQWTGNSKNFKGFLHNATGIISVGQRLYIQTGGGDSYGNQLLDALQDRLRNRKPILLPIINRAVENGNNIELDIWGFAWVKVTKVCANSGQGCAMKGVITSTVIANELGAGDNFCEPYYSRTASRKACTARLLPH